MQVPDDLVPDDLRERIAPLLPPRPPRRHRYPGRLPADDRAANKKGRRRRFGAVRQYRSGRWTASYLGPDGERIRAEETFERAPDASAVNFGTYAEKWVEERKPAVRTEGLYRHLLRLHILPTFGTLDLDEITAPRVREWHAERLRTTAAKTTVAKSYRLLKGILETAVDDDLISRNPALPAHLVRAEVATGAHGRRSPLRLPLLRSPALRAHALDTLRRHPQGHDGPRRPVVREGRAGLPALRRGAAARRSDRARRHGPRRACEEPHRRPPAPQRDDRRRVARPSGAVVVLSPLTGPDNKQPPGR
ncbi:N-terminal phage integrase SAM-like domain-containing protein [Streptomyces griseoviridis]|uniref:N-terminal phage integrase SAM-like domain-containing protein n=1 Tax=Streptomyces griseoviridis TaxID=45398 RepID=UPI0027D7DB8D|nr:N-terminal phage integrase SAM-like domain-containing protein [Streptomyces griseoviridis]